MAELLPKQMRRVYNNDFYPPLLENLMQSKTPDVQFIFNGENDEVKVPAHKELLAVSSPVFNAMFNGELKEKGDVAIVDASADGFKEFLQFFYKKKVELTMDNIEDVLNLTHKYDVTKCFAIAIEFMKEHLTSDKMLWGLQLAIKFQSNELKTFCKEQIANNIDTVLNSFEYTVQGTNGLTISTTDQSLLDTDLTSLWTEVFSVAKQAISESLTKELDAFIIADSRIHEEAEISAGNTINVLKFSPSDDIPGEIRLREIHFAKLYEKNGESFKEILLKGTVTVSHGDRIDFEDQFEVKPNVKHIRLAKPILFDPEFYYFVTVKPSITGYPCKMIDFASNHVNGITDDKLELMSRLNYTLIDRLCFEE